MCGGGGGPKPVDPEKERRKAEAEAAMRANEQNVADSRRKRQQKGVLASGEAGAGVLASGGQ